MEHSHAFAVVAVSLVATLAGAGNSLLSRILQSASCIGTCSTAGTQQPFTKPIFVTLVAFAAMALSLLTPLVVYLARLCKERCTGLGQTNEERRRIREEQLLQKLLFDGDHDFHDTPLKVQQLHVESTERGCVTSIRTCCGRYAVLVVPAALDVLATALQSASVLFISAGVSASMRGSLLLFTGLGSLCAGGSDSRASAGEWAGIGISVAGSTLAGVATLLNSGGATGDAGGLVSIPGWSTTSSSVLGLCLSLSSNFVQGLQVAIETRLLQGHVFTAAVTNGMEGVYGVAMLVLVLAVAQHTGGGSDGGGHVEDSVGTLCCLSHTPLLAYLSLGLACAFLVSTQAYMTLSALRGGNYRALLMVSRSVLVWLVELAVYYGSTANGDGGSSSAGGGSTGEDVADTYGQPFRQWDWLQAIGFVLLIAGGILTWRAQSAREARASGAHAPAVAATGTGAPGGTLEEEEEETYAGPMRGAPALIELQVGYQTPERKARA